MLIVLGGLLGSGRPALARELALKYGLHHYDINRKKRRRPVLDNEGNFPVIQPTTDAERMGVYERALADFPFLSKLHTNVIVDDAFHRQASREHFLSEARKYFDSVVFIWIDADEASITNRLESMRERGKIISIAAGLRRRERAIEALQLNEESTPRFLYTVSCENNGSALWDLIQEDSKN